MGKPVCERSRMGGDIVQVAAEVISVQDMPPGLGDVMARLVGVMVAIAGRIARGGIDEELGGANGTNADGDSQKALDVIADEAFVAALAGSAMRFYARKNRKRCAR